MWEFFGSVFEHGGPTALLFVINTLMSVAAIRFLWARLERVQAELAKSQEQHRRDLDRSQQECFAKMHELQEKRVDEAQMVTKVVVEHTEKTKNAVDRIRAAMETLTELLGGQKAWGRNRGSDDAS